MTDSIDKITEIGKPIRLEKKLKSAIAREKLRLSEIGPKAVSMGDVVQMAWNEYLAARARLNPGSIGTKDDVSSPKIELQEWEVPWVQRVIAVLRSGHGVIVEALQSCIEAFCLISGKMPNEAAQSTPDAATGDTGESLSARVARTAGASGDAAAGGAEHAGRITESLNGEKGSGTKVG